MKIYHNPRCSKSRETLKMLEVADKEFEVVEYLKTPFTAEELSGILAKLKLSAETLLRTGERLFKDKYKGKHFPQEKWIQIMVENPSLIERPIVVNGEKAIIGRPPENVKQLF